MVRDKYTFKLSYHEWVQICAYLKVPQEHAHILPHQRTKGKRIQIMTLSVLKGLTNRLDTRLAVFKPEIRFVIKQHEALAILVANDHGFLSFNISLQSIITEIDRQL